MSLPQVASSFSSSNAIVEALESLRAALTCPICEGILEDPAALVCGHLFCFDCINNGIENGVYRDVRSEASPEKAHVKETKTGRGKSNKALTFCCPICEGAAYKWTIHRMPQLKNFLQAIVQQKEEDTSDSSRSGHTQH